MREAKNSDYDLAYAIVDQMGLGFEFRNCSCGQLPCARLKPIVEALLKAEGKAEPAETCTWTQQEGEYEWNAACGLAFYFTDDGAPSDHSFKFCPKCGKPIEEYIVGEEES